MATEKQKLKIKYNRLKFEKMRNLLKNKWIAGGLVLVMGLLLGLLIAPRQDGSGNLSDAS
jgi:hypothetical protein